jgi:hypothetical protein
MKNDKATGMDCEIHNIAAAIIRHMYENPQAKHNAEGIARYWLFQQKIEEQVDCVLAALRFLIRQGMLLEIQNADGSEYYKINNKRISDIASFLSQLQKECGTEGNEK